MARYNRVNRELPNRVAEHLTGLPLIRVIWRSPPYEGSLGAVIRDGQQCLVFVEPALESASRWHVFLHELAHARLHWKDIPSQGMDAQQEGGTIKRGSTRRLGEVLGKPIEEQADALAHKWEEYADYHAMTYWLEANSAPYDARLLSLLDYPTT